jgi:hypothetical protein
MHRNSLKKARRPLTQLTGSEEKPHVMHRDFRRIFPGDLMMVDRLLALQSYNEAGNG